MLRLDLTNLVFLSKVVMKNLDLVSRSEFDINNSHVIEALILEHEKLAFSSRVKRLVLGTFFKFCCRESTKYQVAVQNVLVSFQGLISVPVTAIKYFILQMLKFQKPGELIPFVLSITLII